MNHRHRIIVFVIFFAANILLIGVGRLSADTGGVEFDGLIEPYVVVEVGSEVPGVIDSMNVDRGDVVSAGQVLATLRSGVEKASLALAKTRAEMEWNIKAKKAALGLAQRNSKRTRDIFESNAFAEQKWDEIKTQEILAEAQLDEAIDQKRLYELEFKQAVEVVNRKIVRSPVAGVVMELFLLKGEYVEDKPILKIAQIDPLNVEVVLSVEYYGSVKVGMHGIVKPESSVGGEYEAIVTIVDKVIDAASGTFGVRLEISNPDFKILPGLKCKVVFLNQ